MAFSREEVTEIYVATFNRAPDAVGLDYWMNDSGFTDINDVASSFFDSVEAKEMYPDGTSYEDMVQNAYQNLFGRSADTGGLTYWIGELDAGHFSQSLMLQAMINGAQDTAEFGNDATYMANKAAVGLDFSDSGQSDVGLAKSIMENITDDIITVQEARSTISSFSMIEASINPPAELYTFTQEWLSGKTVYNVYDDDSNSTFESEDKITFNTDGTFHAISLTGEDIGDSMDGTYSIENGVMIMVDSEETSYIAGIDKLAEMNALKISYSDSYTSVISNSESNFSEYFFLDTQSAENYMNLHSIIDNNESSVELTNEYKFTQEWLNGRILYNVYDENQDGIFDDLTTMTFTNNTMTGVGFDGGESISSAYTVDDNGVITILETDGTITYIGGLEEITGLNTIEIAWSDTYSDAISVTEAELTANGNKEYFFLDLHSAQMFIA